MKKVSHIAVFIKQQYSLDARALSLMRIALALVCILDLCIRLGDLEAHYTNAGIWPTDLIKNFGWNTGYWSIYSFNGTYSFELVLFSFHVAVVFALLIGYKTRLSTCLTWLLYISLHNRNIYILQGGDDLLRLLLFWGIFLPWGSHYSMDSLKTPIKAKQHLTANIAYMLLLASVYFFSALLKTSADWTSDFDAVYYALSLEQLRLPLGDTIYDHPVLLKLITVLVYAIELIAPLIILWPQKKGKLRLAACLLIIALHVGIGLTLYVGLFFLIGIVSVIGLLPAPVFDKAERFFKVKKNTGVFIIQPIKHRIRKRIEAVVLILVIFLCLIVNLGSLPYNPYQLKSELFYPVNSLRLNQNWGMFAPGVLRHDGWLVYHGMDSIGRQWDLRLNQDYVDYHKPERIVSMYKNDRWRKLAENMQNNNYTFLRPLYCKFKLKEWNTLHPHKKMDHLDLYFMEKINLANYAQSLPEKRLYCSCYVH